MHSNVKLYALDYARGLLHSDDTDAIEVSHTSMQQLLSLRPKDDGTAVWCRNARVDLNVGGVMIGHVDGDDIKLTAKIKVVL